MKKSSATLLAGFCTAFVAIGIVGVVSAQQPAPGGASGPAVNMGGAQNGRPQNQVPKPEDVAAMMAALPDKAPARPAKPRKVLVLCKANGYVHSSIPLAARTVEELGKKTGAWSTTITYDPASITADNLKQYDLLFLDSTTGAFLDDPNDPAVTAARKQALLDFVRGGKGLAGIHAATDSYHGGGRGRGPAGASGTMAAAMPPARTVAGATAAGATATPRPASQNLGTWPEFNEMIGGFFKFHWLDPQLITVKIDDPRSPLTAMFHGQEFEIHDETYTFAQDSFSRERVHVLTSIDYDKMNDADKAKETNKRTDGDYALSYIQRVGKGRVFYEAHGHNERIYAMKPMLEHLLAGIQYAIGDLKADDSPSVKPAKK